MLLRLARATAGHLCSKRRGRSHGSLARILRLALPPVALRSPMTGNELLPRRQPGISDSNPDCPLPDLLLQHGADSVHPACCQTATVPRIWNLAFSTFEPITPFPAALSTRSSG